jgi:hypothetical protein
MDVAVGFDAYRDIVDVIPVVRALIGVVEPLAG